MRAKLNALGQFACGVAHDLNNYLSPAHLFTEVLLRECTNDAQREKLQAIETSVDSCIQLMCRLLVFGKNQYFELRPIRLACVAKGGKPS